MLAWCRVGNRLVFTDIPVVDQSISGTDGNEGERTAIHVARFDQCNQRISVFDQITYDDATGGARGQQWQMS